MSAKHGLIPPGRVISPYDRHIDDLTPNERRTFVDMLVGQLECLDMRRDSQFTSLCIPEYTEFLEMAGICPKTSRLASLPKEEKHSLLRTLTDSQATESTLEEVYNIVERLTKDRGLVPFRDAIQKEMPLAGVYLFFDPDELRLRNPNRFRIVRVGTHGVAAGSKALLKDRMRTHFGTGSGGGNHRSSIFRLHVGRSLICAGLADDVKSWGDSEFPKSDRVRRREEALEAKVSTYIGNLLVAMIGVPGFPSKNNDRAYLEQNLIALLSNNYAPLDPPSHRWLGRYSEKKEIRKSALWNVNHTSQSFDQRFPEMLDYYVSLMLGRQPNAKPVAPTDWIANVRGNNRQLSLFSAP